MPQRTGILECTHKPLESSRTSFLFLRSSWMGILVCRWDLLCCFWVLSFCFSWRKIRDRRVAFRAIFVLQAMAPIPRQHTRKDEQGCERRREDEILVKNVPFQATAVEGSCPGTLRGTRSSCSSFEANLPDECPKAKLVDCRMCRWPAQSPAIAAKAIIITAGTRSDAVIHDPV